MRLPSISALIAGSLLAVAISGCGGRAVPQLSSPPASSDSGARDVRMAGEAKATSAPFAEEQFGGYEGEKFYARKSGAAFEYSENVAVRFTQPLETKTFSYTIEPATVSHVYFGNDYLRTADITVRKVPGTKYTLMIAAGVKDAAGDALARPVVETFTTAAVPQIEKPERSTAGEPYRYGVLEHPFPTSLRASNGPEQIATIAKAGVRFVKIDYCGGQSEASKAGKFDFDDEDAIMDQLVKYHITELPVVEQFCAPAWATAGNTLPNPVWSTPEQYAQFAAGVAAHVAKKYPQITRIELFNEPNIFGWWFAPAPYANADGGDTGKYMLAAYRAVKAVAPKMTIVGPAIADGGLGVTDPRIFLENMYAAGCKTGRCWDVLSVHNYAWENPNFATLEYFPSTYFDRYDIYKDLQSIALAHGETAKPHVMFTEWGISTDPTNQNAFDPAVQAQYISIMFNKMNADPTVDGLVYANIYNPGTDFFSMMSLTEANFKPLPGFAVFQEFASH